MRGVVITILSLRARRHRVSRCVACLPCWEGGWVGKVAEGAVVSMSHCSVCLITVTVNAPTPVALSCPAVQVFAALQR